MKNLFIKQAMVLSLIVVNFFAYSQDAALLKYNFVKGKTYVIFSQLDNIVTQTMGGQEIKIEAGILSNSEMLVEGIDDKGNITLLATLKNASISTKIPAMGKDTTMNFSNLDEQRRVVLSSTGKQIASVNLNEEKVQKMISSINQFTRLQNLPGKALKIGEKWNDKLIDSTKASQQNPVNMVVTTDMEYTIVGKELKDGVELLKIANSGAMSITGQGNMQGMELYVEGTGKSEGFSYFNPKASMVVNTEANIEMDMSIAVTGQQNMTMPMNQSMKAIVKIEEKK
ncbi:MAG: hypothetical protein EHM93_00320 [Bacteroidales bacterium]|nr:MAG: hypothetical protein EHM93_00320 [Bacteroidales bacterium]